MYSGIGFYSVHGAGPSFEGRGSAAKDVFIVRVPIESKGVTVRVTYMKVHGRARIRPSRERGVRCRSDRESAKEVTKSKK